MDEELPTSMTNETVCSITVPQELTVCGGWYIALPRPHFLSRWFTILIRVKIGCLCCDFLPTAEYNLSNNNNNCPRKKGVQYIPRNMHTVFASLCFVVVIHWLIFPYPSGLLHWHCAVPAKQPRWIWINTSCEFIMNDCIITTKQSTTKPCAYFLGYTV